MEPAAVALSSVAQSLTVERPERPAPNQGKPVEQETDEELVERALAEPEAFNQLVVRYQHRIYSLAYRMVGNGTDANDLAQDTFIRAFHHLDTFQQGRRFAPWLYRIAINLCLDYRQQRPVTVSLDDQELPQQELLPEARAIQREVQEKVHKAIMALPPKYRAVIALRHLQDLSYEEIAAALDLPINTVRTHLFRARDALRKVLQSDELL
ncbi:MAG: sigma-70 family RNA polymerase sigma factor [Chloroflexi bacterium]|nr:sigma-70 family RNA polymerase sigma factor [Chloroflexota bacterium]